MTEHISTEEAEDIARELDFDCKCFKCSQSPQQVGANTIRSLAAERDELREKILTEDEAYRAGYRDGRRDARDFGPSE